jgi:hypothetical protein
MKNISYEHYRPKKGEWLIQGIKRGGSPLHWCRRYYRGANQEWEADAKGGYTVCIITTVDGTQYSGIGVCSVADNFSYAEGRKWAFKYAVDAMIEGAGMRVTPEYGAVALEDNVIVWAMPLEDGKTLAKYIKSFLNNSYFSDTARNELYGALQNAYVHGSYS